MRPALVAVLEAKDQSEVFSMHHLPTEASLQIMLQEQMIAVKNCIEIISINRHEQ